MALACMASCGSGSDDSTGPTPPPDPEKKLDHKDSVLQQCSFNTFGALKGGNTFTVVLMADGYTQADIDNGKYLSALREAKNALFSMEPMKSLERYVNVLTVTVPSKHSGIDTKKHDTAFRTSVAAGRGTDVYGDSITAQYCAAAALMSAYNITTQDELNTRMNNCLGIMLLNSSAYKGVSLLAADEAATDGIPGGWSLSYVPARATFEGKDVFADLIQHEGVGHGIAKLADEYVVNYVAPQQKAINAWTSGYAAGFFMNTTYNASAGQMDAVMPIESTNWLYSFAQNPVYADENVQWHVGAYEYSTRFCRCSDKSVMNATTDKAYYPEAYDPYFNVAGRAMIYKRIMRVVNGSSWKFNDYLAEFVNNFDRPAREEKARYMAKKSQTAAKVQSVPYYIESRQQADAPRLQAPKIIKQIEVKIDR